MPFDASDYTDETFDGLALSGERLAGLRFTGCTFRGCTFEETRLVDCLFRECAFEGCAWILVELAGVTLRETVFREGKVVGLALGADALARSPFTGIRFERTRLAGCTLDGLELPDFAARACVLSECLVQDCRLPGADFSESRFERTVFLRCGLERADFRGAEGYAIDPRETRLGGARFSPAGALGLLAPFGIVID